MIEILQKEKKSAFLLSNQKLSPGVKYKWSVFTLLYEKDGERYIYNNLSTQLYRLYSDDGVEYDKERLLSFDEISGNPALTQLAHDYFLVPENEDEDRMYENLIDIMWSIEKVKIPKGINSYTILPTTACNARCFYCFEQGMKIVTMTPEIISATVEYIIRTKCEGKIFLNWFGGEPLLRDDIIDKICAELKERGVEFESFITTNGSLITPDMARKMKNNWNLTRAQVSLDGDEEEYNRRKAYINLGGSPYRLVLNNIGLLLEQGIKVNLRCNIDKDNLEGIDSFFDDLKSAFPDKSNLSLEFVSMYDNHSTPYELPMYIKTTELNSKAHSLGFSSKKSHMKFATMLYYCPAQIYYTTMVIDPSGNLFACEHCAEGTEIGNVFDGVTNKEISDKYLSHPPVSKKCSGCFFLPKCTTFDMCPIKNSSAECREIKRHYLIGFLEHTIGEFNKENK